MLTEDSVNLLLQFIFLCVCVCTVYLGSKSPAAGNVAVCQDLLIGVWGRDYEGWETYIHTKQDRGKNATRKSPFTNSRRVLLLSLLRFCSPAPFSECLHLKCLTVPCVQTFLALAGSAGIAEPAPVSHRHSPGEGGAMRCQSSYAGPHTSFLLISPPLQSLL